MGRDYTLVQVPIGLHFDDTDSLTDATHGTRADAVITPTKSLGRGNATFTIAQISAAQFLDLGAPKGGSGREVLALRALVGTVQGAGTFAIPPDQRFYGGGSGTIRGYRYQSVSPLLGNGKPAGGTSIAAGDGGIPPAHRRELGGRGLRRQRRGLGGVGAVARASS